MPLPTVRRLRALLLAPIAASVAALLLPAAGNASLVPATNCTVAPGTHPFLAWGDGANYVLAPGGDGSFAGWTLGSGVTPVAGGPLGLTSALSIPAGAAAVSPATCINVPHATARLFVRTDSPGAKLTVSAVYDNGKHVITIPAGGAVSPGTSWAPTDRLKIHPVILPALHGPGTAEITLRFVADHGTVQIDDVFLDPWSRW